MNHLLLLHGALGHSDQMKAYEKELSKHFEVHNILFAGHGNTPLPKDGLSIPGYVKQLQDYCRSHQLEKVSVFGYSMGGYVGLVWALKEPQRIESLLTLGTKIEWSEAGAAQEIKMLNPAKIKEKVPDFATSLANLHGTEKWESLLSAMAGLMLQLGKQPLLHTDALQHLKTRVQLMVGDRDTMVSQEETRQLVSRIPEASFAVLPDTVHHFEKVRESVLLPMTLDFFTR